MCGRYGPVITTPTWVNQDCQGFQASLGYNSEFQVSQSYISRVCLNPKEKKKKKIPPPPAKNICLKNKTIKKNHNHRHTYIRTDKMWSLTEEGREEREERKKTGTKTKTAISQSVGEMKAYEGLLKAAHLPRWTRGSLFWKVWSLHALMP